MPLRPTFDRIFNDPAAMRLWFANPITYSEALTLNGVYVPFTDIGGAVLRMLAATRGITISDADGAELTDKFATIPPHPEVPAACAGSASMASGCSRSDNTLEISTAAALTSFISALAVSLFALIHGHKIGPAAWSWRSAGSCSSPQPCCP